MVLLEPNETRFDLRWRMFGIPVRVHPMFWLVTLVMGEGAFRMGVAFLLIWVGCVFVSILIHELGHALTFLAFGVRSQIVLYGFGGLAIGGDQLDHRWQRIAVSAAGPVAGFLFLGLVFGAVWVREPATLPVYVAMTKRYIGWPIEQPPIRPAVNAKVHNEKAGGPNAAKHKDKDDDADDAPDAERKDIDRDMTRVYWMVAVFDLIFINLVWGLLNLLPVWPLDGGQISREVCQGVTPDHGLYVSLGISLVTAGILCLHCILSMNGFPLLPLRFGSWYTALLFGLLAWGSLQLLNQLHHSSESDEPWHREDNWQ